MSEKLIQDIIAKRMAIKEELATRREEDKVFVASMVKLYKDFIKIGESTVNCHVTLNLGKFGDIKLDIYLRGDDNGNLISCGINGTPVVQDVGFIRRILGMTPYTYFKYEFNMYARDIGNFRLTWSGIAEESCVFNSETTEMNRKKYEEYTDFTNAIMKYDIFTKVIQCKQVEVTKEFNDYCA